jgi:hypothetical protein
MPVRPPWSRPAHQGANFLDVDQDRHIATLTAGPPFLGELAVQYQPDKFLAHAEGQPGGFGDGDLACLGRLHGPGASEQLIEECIEVFGGELVGVAVVYPADAGEISPDL